MKRDYCFEPHGPQATDTADRWRAIVAFAAYIVALVLCDLIDRSL